MECHKCPERAAIESGKFKRVAFDETPCAKCELKESSERTMEYVQERESSSQNPPSFAKATAGMESRSGDEEARLPLSVMNELVVRLMSMTPESRDVVCWRFSGMSFREIAAAQGITVAGAEVRLWRALEKWPELRALFATKLARHGRRKSVARRRNSESRRMAFDK